MDGAPNGATMMMMMMFSIKFFSSYNYMINKMFFLKKSEKKIGGVITVIYITLG